MFGWWAPRILWVSAQCSVGGHPEFFGWAPRFRWAGTQVSLGGSVGGRPGFLPPEKSVRSVISILTSTEAV